MSIKKLNDADLIKEYQISIPFQTIQDLTKEELIKISAKMKIPGFRPGKVPMSIVEGKYKESVKLEMAERQMKILVSKIIDDNKLNVLENDIKTLSGINNGIISGDLEILVKFDLLPNIILPDFSKMQFEKIKLVFSSDEIIDYQNKFLESLKEFSIISNDQSKLGDLVLIDYKLKVKDSDKEELQNNFKFTLGAGQVFPEFEQHLFGVKKGDKLNFTVTMPLEYTEIAGKIGEFIITVKEVKSPEIPTLNEDLAIKQGFSNTEELKKYIEDLVRKNFESNLKLVYTIKLFDALESILSFEVPSKYLLEEKEILKKEIDKANQNSQDKTEYDEDKIDKIALRRLRIGMMLDHYAEEFNLKLSRDEMTKAFSEQMMQIPENMREKAAQFYSKNPKATKALFGPLLEDKIVQDIITKINVDEKEYSVKELENLIVDIEKRSSLI